MFPLYAPTLLNVALRGRPAAPAILFVGVSESAVAAEQQAGSTLSAVASLEAGVGAHQQSAQAAFNAARSESGSAADARDAVVVTPTWTQDPLPSKVFYNGAQETYDLRPFALDFNPSLHGFRVSPALPSDFGSIDQSVGPTFDGTAATFSPTNYTWEIYSLAGGATIASAAQSISVATLVDNWPARAAASDWANRLETQADLDLYKHSVPSPAHVVLETSIKVPGALASFRVNTFNSDGPNSGMIRLNFGAVRTFTWGDTIWWGYRFRAPASMVYHPWIGDYNTGIKQSIFSNFNASFQLNECTNNTLSQSGCINGYNLNGNGAFDDVSRTYDGVLHLQPGIDQGSATPLSGVNPDNGAAWATNDHKARRYGDIYQGHQSERYRGGYGDPIVNIGRIWPDEDIAIICCLNAGTLGVANSRWREWMCRGNGPPLLVWDEIRDLGNGPVWSAIWLGPYCTGRSGGGRRATSLIGLAGLAVLNVSPGMEIGNATLEYDAAVQRMRVRTPNDGFGGWRGFSVAQDIMTLNVSTASDQFETDLAAQAILPQATIDVLDASGFPASGTVLIGNADTTVGGPGVQQVQYTGKSGNTLTGCSGGTGTHPAGRPVVFESYLQIKVANPSALPQSGTAQATIAVADEREATYICYNDATVGRKPVLTPGGHTLSFTPPYPLPASGEVIDLVSTLINNFMEDIRPGNYTTTQFRDSVMGGGYSGGTMAKDYGEAGGYVIAGTGGHNASEWIDAAIFDFAVGRWRHLPNANGVTARPTPYQDSELTSEPWRELNGTQVPGALHAYLYPCVIPPGFGGGLNGSFVSMMGNPGSLGPASPEGSKTGPHKMDLMSGLWSRASISADNDLFDQSGTFGGISQGCSAVDENTGRIYRLPHLMHGGPKQFRYLDLTTGLIQSTATWTSWNASEISRPSAFIHVGHNLLIVKSDFNGGASQQLHAWQLSNFAAGPTPLNVSGTIPPSQLLWSFFPDDGCFYLYTGSGNQLHKLQPPASNPLTSQWVVTTRTLSSTPRPAYLAGGGAPPYSRFFYVPRINRMAWIADTNVPMQLIMP